VPGRHEVADELHVVGLQQWAQQLGREVTVTVVDLVEVLDTMRRPAAVALGLGSLPPLGCFGWR